MYHFHRKPVTHRHQNRLLRSAFDQRIEHSTKSIDPNQRSSRWRNESESSSESTFSDTEATFAKENHSKLDATLVEELATWKIESKTSSYHMNKLLLILKKFVDHSLPADSRTLCRTPVKSSVRIVNGSKYHYNGIKKCLKDHLKSYLSKYTDTCEINIDFNVDGIGISNSSTQCLLPILMNVVDYPEIHLIACHAGINKPADMVVYLTEFTTELKDVLSNGFDADKRYTIKLRSFSCDAVARADVLSIKHHNSYEPCHKCKVRSIRHKNRQIFLTLNDELRTSEDFLLRTNSAHHTGQTSAFDMLANVIDVPKTFTVDYMHCVLLGVTKHLLTLWILERGRKWSLHHDDIQNMSKLQESIAKQLPQEFCRASRSFQLVKRFKATEFRLLLLYTLPLILRFAAKMSKRRYDHFLKLHSAIRILSDSTLCMSSNQCAKDLLRDFVADFRKYYDEQYMSFNIHSLLHLADDVAVIQAPLDSYSCFKFENYLQTLKKTPKSGHLVLEQIANRHRERMDHNIQWKEWKEKSLTLKSLSSKTPDNYCLLSNNKLCRIEKITDSGKLQVRFVDKCKPFFEDPVNSKELSMMVVCRGEETTFLNSRIEQTSLSAVKRKVCHFRIDDKHIFISLLHQIEVLIE